jgi:kumamolisin
MLQSSQSTSERVKAFRTASVPINHNICTTWILNNNTSNMRIKNTLENAGLTVFTMPMSHLSVKGPQSAYNKIFASDLSLYNFTKNSRTYYAISKETELHLSMKENVNNILGFNTIPKFVPHIKKRGNTRSVSSYTPPQIASLYGFPSATGTGQKIGIIELGGGYTTADLIAYFRLIGLDATHLNITSVLIDGGTNNPSDIDSSSEVNLDIDIIASLVPDANIRVYFAPNTDRGFYDAILAAINDNCSVISISWGAPEDEWDISIMQSFSDLFQTASENGISIFVASGDTGSIVDFPASSPFVTSCGGTTIKTNGHTPYTLIGETVWDNSVDSATGGGISTAFVKPSYQPVYLSGRGVPDISANADPNTGYLVYMNGSQSIYGGTSAVAPLWAALTARINQLTGKSMGLINYMVYSNPNICRDITQGKSGKYSATVGWDACTGLGSPNAANYLAVANNSSIGSPLVIFNATPVVGTYPLIVSFTDQSTGSPFYWFWDFGDGSTSTLKNPVYTYTRAGVYNVRLQATNLVTASALTKSNYITVTTPPPPPPHVPSANFTGSPVSGVIPLMVEFVDSSTNTPTYWNWTFGDGSISTLKNPNYIYTRPGKYTVTLTAGNNAGSGVVKKNNYINIDAPPIKITADFTATPLTIKRGQSVTFTDISSGNPTSWYWDFGNGHVSTQQNPIQIFTTVGNYTIKLTASNSNSNDKVTKGSYIKVTA